jgi:hypothetical protein
MPVKAAQFCCRIKKDCGGKGEKREEAGLLATLGMTARKAKTKARVF